MNDLTRTLSMAALNSREIVSKVPQVTLTYWLIKIAATTLGETAGDTLSMSMNLGYLISTFVLSVFFFVLVYWQVKAIKFHPFLYWATIIATTTVGTTLADFADRSLGIGYAGGSLLLLTLLIGSITLWYQQCGTVNIASVNTFKSEVFYWLTIMLSQTLGTALGDWTADTAGLGYLGGATIFGGALLLLVIAFYFTQISRTVLFWLAFVLTRPLGAVLGDFLDKPLDHGGLALSRFGASLILTVFILFGIKLFKQTAAVQAH